jgi:hypothetical protein
MISRNLRLCLLAPASLVAVASIQPARAQVFGHGVDFGALETGVLPNGAELPDLTGDTLDPNTTPPPKRAEALPPPPGFFDPPATPVKKARKSQR